MILWFINVTIFQKNLKNAIRRKRFKMFEKDETVWYRQGVSVGYELAIEQVKRDLQDDMYRGFREDFIEHLNNMKEKNINAYMKLYLHLEDKS